MVNSRHIEESDLPLLEQSLRNDPFHEHTTPEFFYGSRSMCNVYEDDNGPVLFCRGTKALRIDIQFLDNRDFARNRDVMVGGLPDLEAKAREAGFTELIFCSTSPLLVRFCKKLGFAVVEGELRKFI